MKILSGPRGIIAFDESQKVLETIKDNWPGGERLHISDWAGNDQRKSSRRK